LQTYQLISLLENKHPTVTKGYETIKNTYVEIIEEHILKQEIRLATKNLQKMLRTFPELEGAKHIKYYKDQIDTINKIAQLLIQADKHIANNNLAGSNNENAHILYKSVLKLSPKNKEAKQGIVNISDKYLKNINQLIDNKHYKKALTDIDIAENIHPKFSNKFTALRTKIKQRIKDDLSTQKKNSKIKQLLTDANYQKKIGNIVTPQENNALFLYQQILNNEPNNQEAQKAIRQIEKLLLINVYEQSSGRN